MAKSKKSKVAATAVAGFMVFIMIISALASIYWGSGNDDDSAAAQPTATPDTRIPLSSVGKLIDHRFDSITDGLEMSPPGAIAVRYIDAEDLDGTPLEPLKYQHLQPYETYGTNIVRSYHAGFWDGTWIELHELYPRKFNFGVFITQSPTRYNDRIVLIRNKDIVNIMGDPCILGPRTKVEATVDVIEDENASNSYPYFSELLLRVDSDAPYQMMAMNSPIASQYHDAMRAVDGSCERTITLIGATENTTAILNKLAANTTDEIECNVTFDQGDLNLTIARITGDYDAAMGARIYES